MPSTTADHVFTVLVTGANSGLGFGTCCRLIDDFLTTRPAPQTLHLLFTTRSPAKNVSTRQSLEAHLDNTISRKISQADRRRIRFEGLSVELTTLRSVKSLAEQLCDRGQKIDAAVWNAGIGGWAGIDWPKAVWTICTDLVYATTFPAYQIGIVGAKARPQGTAAKSENGENAEQEPVLGQVFTANVFGHYMLTHWLAPLFHSDSRVIWTSSLSARDEALRLDDLQGLKTDVAYDSSKRVTDLLVLTSELPSTKRWTQSFLPSDERPQHYVTHPGICGTAISELNAFLMIFVAASFYIARLLGSPWHNIQGYKGASSTVACVLSPSLNGEGVIGGTAASPIPSIASSPSIIESEQRHGKAKWGSSCSLRGDEAVVRTETEGWGFGSEVGKVPGGSMKGHMPGDTKKTDKEARENFEEQGGQVWRQMEEMRLLWEGRLEGK